MYRRAYALYLRTFRDLHAALEAGDEERLHALCVEVAGRDGLASTVSMMAMSDAECSRSARSRAHVVRMLWRNALAYGAVPASYRESAQQLGKEARAA